MSSSLSQFQAVRNELLQVWKRYGRCAALIRSPFLHLSILLAAASVGAWWSKDWWLPGMAVIPSLLGFSVATFAVFVAIGDDKFRSSLANGGARKIDALLDIYSSFLVLIAVQVVALLFSLFASSRPMSSALALFDINIGSLPEYARQTIRALSAYFRFSGWLLIVYSVVAILPMSLSVFRMARMYFMHLSKEKGDNPATQSGRGNGLQ